MSDGSKVTSYKYDANGCVLDEKGQKSAIIMNWVDLFPRYKSFVSNITDLNYMFLNGAGTAGGRLNSGSGYNRGNNSNERVYQQIMPPVARIRKHARKRGKK